MSFLGYKTRVKARHIDLDDRYINFPKWLCITILTTYSYQYFFKFLFSFTAIDLKSSWSNVDIEFFHILSVNLLGWNFAQIYGATAVNTYRCGNDTNCELIIFNPRGRLPWMCNLTADDDDDVALPAFGLILIS